MKIRNVILYVSMALVIVGIVLHVLGLAGGVYVLAVGGFAMFCVRTYSRAICTDKAKMRLCTILIFSSLMVVAAAWVIYTGRRYWVIPLLVCSVLELYVSFRGAQS